MSPSLAKCTQLIESAIPQDKLAKPRPNLSINRLESLNRAFKPQKQNETKQKTGKVSPTFNSLKSMNGTFHKTKLAKSRPPLRFPFDKNSRTNLFFFWRSLAHICEAHSITRWRNLAHICLLHSLTLAKPCPHL